MACDGLPRTNKKIALDTAVSHPELLPRIYLGKVLLSLSSMAWPLVAMTDLPLSCPACCLSPCILVASALRAPPFSSQF